MNKITYVFGHGRRKKILQGKGFAKEFFYSYQEFVNDGNLVEIVEMEEEIFTPRGSRKIYKYRSLYGVLWFCFKIFRNYVFKEL